MPFVKPIIFLLCLLPLSWLIYQAGTGQLGPDAGKALVLETGEWGLRFLIFTLAITPLRQFTRNPSFTRYRRMIGLYTWFYASLHFVCVLTYMLGWSWLIFLEEFSERPYMAVGIMAWILLFPLGLTSNRWSMRRLGSRWKSLHKLIYLIAVLVSIHIIWLVRSDYGEALFYSVVILLLLLTRIIKARGNAVGISTS